MSEEKKCNVCGKTDSPKWIERKNLMGKKAYFCTAKCYSDYKAKSAETGVCEFC
ncbi:MAG: hypothetical protein ACP5N9_02855 [Candidatus Bilamarchaeum sp.]|jgi:hypothetical protein